MNIQRYVIPQNASVRDAMEKLNTGDRILFVVDKDNYILGALSDGDIRRWILAGNDINETVDKAMNTAPKVVTVEQNEKARKYIHELKLHAVPVVDDNNHLIDVISRDQEGVKTLRKRINCPVVIMAGGKGERLKPYTNIVPKPLIPIGEKPISELVIDSFRDYGCSDFYFTLNYKKNMIKAYYDELERDYDVHYVEEDMPLGTGGSLYYLRDKISSTFFVSNCDILLRVDYSDVLNFHKKQQNLITVVTSLKSFKIPYGTVKLDDGGRIGRLEEKPSNDYLINTGVYVLEPEVFNYLQDKKSIHLTEIVELAIKDNKNVGTYPISEEAWLDMGQFEDMERMKAML